MTLEAEIYGSVKILKGPPVPVVLPAKGIGFFFEDGKAQFYVLSQFNNSDTTLRTPVSFKNAMKMLWALRQRKA